MTGGQPNLVSLDDTADGRIHFLKFCQHCIQLGFVHSLHSPLPPAEPCRTSHEQQADSHKEPASDAEWQARLEQRVDTGQPKKYFGPGTGLVLGF